MARPDITAYITANSRDFHAALGKVRTDAKRTASDTGKGFAAMAEKLRGGVAAVGRFAGPAGIAAGALVALAHQAKQTADAVLEIDAAARTAGVGFEAFQELKFAAEQNLIGVDALTDGLKELQLRADEFIKTGQGPAADAFGRLNMSARQLADGLKEPDKLFEEVITRLRRLDDQAAQIRIADEIFGGTAGEQFTRLLTSSASLISDNREEARKLGAVLSDDVRQKAEEINREWNRMATIVSTNVKSSIIDVASVVLGILQSFRELMNLGSRVQPPDVGVDDINAELQLLAQERADTVDQLSMAAEAGNIALQTRFEQDLAAIDQQIEALNQRLEAIKQITDETTITSDGPTLVGPYTGNIPVPERRPDEQDNASRTKANAALQKQADLVRQVTEALEFELQTMALSDLERETMTQLRRANVDASSAEGQHIAELVDELYREKDAQAAAEEAARRHAEAMDELRTMTLGWIEDAINGTLNWRDVLIDVIRQLELAAQGQGIFAGLFSGGGGGSFLSGIASALFGGGRATGGDVSPGRYYRINEKEYFAPSTSGRIIPPNQMGAQPQRLQLELSPDLIGKVLDEADRGALRIVKASSGGMIQGAVEAVGRRARRDPRYLGG